MIRLRLRETVERRFAVKGHADRLCDHGRAHTSSSDKRADLVLSGVNRGRNAAEDVTYSGTVAGAMEGAVLGIPSFALSQAYRAASRKEPHWRTAWQYAARSDPPRAEDRRCRATCFVNVNFPDCPPEAVTGDRGRLRKASAIMDLLHIEPRYDGRGNPYYWIAFARNAQPEPRDGTDLSALAQNRIAVTPLRLDLTDEPFMTTLAQLFS